MAKRAVLYFEILKVYMYQENPEAQPAQLMAGPTSEPLHPQPTLATAYECLKCVSPCPQIMTDSCFHEIRQIYPVVPIHPK